MQLLVVARLRARHLRDVIVGSDPGLARLRQAVAGAGSMGSALGIEYAFAVLRGYDSMSTLVAMLLGAVISMMGAMALNGPRSWSTVRTAAGFPVAMGVGMLPGVAVGDDVTAMLAVFVLIMFVAVLVRRFGPAFFFFGFMLWMGYFFSAFLHATVATLPDMIVDVAVGSAWVLLLACTVLHVDPGRTLAGIRRSFGARARRLADACVDLLDEEPADRRALVRLRRRVESQQARLLEAALMMEGWSGSDRALPPGWSPQALRRRILDLQLTMERLAAASEELSPPDPGLCPTAASRGACADAIRPMVTRDYATAARRADALLARTGAGIGTREAAAIRRLASAVRDYAALVARAGTPPEVDAEGEFTPAVTLAFGNLPGSVSVASQVEIRGRSWNPLARMDFVTRQAVQVAIAGGLAILFGRELNSTRYYWAVIAAFIAFTGTGSRSETFLKASNRVLGTLVGLLAGIGLAHLTAGSTSWTLTVIVGSMFCGLYLVQASYAYMIFFVTIMVAQLYSVLHEFSDALLVLRLEETAIGAAVGIAVGLLVVPVGTRDTVTAAQRTALSALGDLLDAVGERAADAGAHADAQLDAAARTVDSTLRALNKVAAPLTRPLLLANDPRLARHRLTLHATAAREAKSLLAALRDGVLPEPGPLARPIRALAAAATALAERPPPLGTEPGGDPAVAPHLADADAALFAEAGAASAGSAAVIRLHGVVRELVGPGPRGGVRRLGALGTPEGEEVAVTPKGS